MYPIKIISLLRVTAVETAIGMKRSSIYNMISKGLLPKPVKQGKASLWPDYEIQKVIQAIIGNKSNDEIKILVNNLMQQRIK